MNKVRAYFPKSGHFIQFSRKGRVASPLLPPIFLLVAPLYCYFWADCLPLCGSLEAKACGELQIYAAPNFLHCYKGSEEHYEFVQSLDIRSLLVWIDQYLEDVLYWQWRHRRCAKAVPIEHWRQNALSVTCVQLFFVHL